MGGKPYQSCLAPFENEILELRRRKRPMSCAQIAEHIRKAHKIQVSRGTVLNFLKVRAKGYKPCKYAGCIKPINDVNQPTTEVPSLHKQTVSEVRETPKQSVAVNPATSAEPETEFKMEFSETYNLHRLPPEEAAERNRRIQEKRRMLEEEQRRKENQSTETKTGFKMEWSDVYNLTRLSDEEAAERRRRIEEKRKRLMEEQLKKEKQ